jgi:hypothetical protein
MAWVNDGPGSTGDVRDLGDARDAGATAKADEAAVGWRLARGLSGRGGASQSIRRGQVSAAGEAARSPCRS